RRLPGVRQGRLYRPAQHVGSEWLPEKVDRAGLHRVDRQLDRAVGGDHHHPRLRVALPDVPEDLDALHAWHALVEEDQIPLLPRAELLPPLRTVRGRFRSVANRIERDLHGVADLRFVIDDQDLGSTHCPASGGWRQLFAHLPPLTTHYSPLTRSLPLQHVSH